jgi:hypothetical protein
MSSEFEGDEVSAAALLSIVREDLRRYVPGGGEQFLDRYLAASAPKRATDASGRGVWRHTCGSVRTWDEDPTNTTGCSWCYKSGSWQALYTLPGGAA